MTSIAVGNTVANRATTSGQGVTCIDLNNPCDGTGIIETVSFWLATNTTGLQVGIFQPMGNGVYRTRASASLGSYAAGLYVDVPVSLACYIGDYIGFFFTTGSIEADSAGGVGLVSKTGNFMDSDTYFAPGATNTWIASILGYGNTTALAPEAQSIFDEIDRMYADDYPGANAWLSQHWDFEAGPLLLAHNAYNAINGGGGGGGGITLADLQAELDTRFGAVAVALATELGNIRYDIGVNQAPSTGILAALQTHDATVASEITTAQNNVIAAMPDCDPVDFSGVYSRFDDVDTANATINSNVDGSRNTILAAIAGLATTLGVFAVGQTVKSLLDTIDSVTSAINTLLGTTKTVVDATKTVADNIYAEFPISVTAPAMPPVYQGRAHVTFGSTYVLTQPFTIAEACDGVLVEAQVIPAGQSRQLTPAGVRYKGLAWLAFKTDAGELEARQAIELDSQLVTPQSMDRASGLEVYVKAGCTLQVKLYTNTP